MKTAAQVWLQYGRDLNVDAAIKGFAAVDSENKRLRTALTEIHMIARHPRSTGERMILAIAESIDEQTKGENS